MAYGIHYTTQYFRRSGGETLIDILEKDYGGGVTTLLADADCLQIDIDGKVDNIYEPTRGSGATIKLLVNPLTFVMGSTSFFTVDPQKYIVKIYSDTDKTFLVWQGFVNTGYYQEDYSTSILTPIVLNCNDGMAALEDMYYRPTSNTTYTGFTDVSTVMGNIFSKLGISFTTIRTSDDLLVADYSRNPFAYLTVNHENYIDEKGIPMSCRQVLNSIWGALGKTITFRGDIVYMIDPINLHDVSKGYTYGVSPAWGSAETQQNLGGYVDISVSGNTLSWYETGQILDVVQPFNQIQIKYDPYSYCEGNYDFNGSDENDVPNAGVAAVTGTYTNDGTTYKVYTGVEMNGWTSPTGGFEGIQKVVTGTTDLQLIDYYIKQEAGQTGYFEYTFPYSNIKQDENMMLELTMDIYVNTKHETNLWSNAEGTLVKEIQIPIEVKVGDQWNGGGNDWTTTEDTNILTLRTPNAYTGQRTQVSGILFWRHTELLDIDESVINDMWTTGKIQIDMGQSSLEDLIYGSITVRIPYEMTFNSVEPWTAEAQIKNLLIKNINVKTIKANLTTISNDGVNTLATLYSLDTIKKSPLTIELKHGCGTYGCSKGAFSTDQQVIQGINISGLTRSIGGTYYSTNKLLGQSLISQYNQPRLKLVANLDVTNYLLSIEQKLITNSKYLGTKAFYIALGTYYDGEENMKVEMIELVSTREDIIDVPTGTPHASGVPKVTPTPTPSAPAVKSWTITDIAYVNPPTACSSAMPVTVYTAAGQDPSTVVRFYTDTGLSNTYIATGVAGYCKYYTAADGSWSCYMAIGGGCGGNASC